LVRYLCERFPGVPRYLASLEYRRTDAETLVLAMLQEYVSHQGDAWTLLQGALRRYYEEVLTGQRRLPGTVFEGGSPLDTDHGRIEPAVMELIGGFCVQFAESLGRRTAEMHSALASSTDDPLFAPEPFTRLYQRSLYQSLRTRILRNLRMIENALSGRELLALEDHNRAEMTNLLSKREQILAALKPIVEHRISGLKTRVHGDYNLQQVLFTGGDFMIIDFEGEPGIAPGARRLKYSPLRDVADMIRSFYYAAYSAMYQHAATHPEDLHALQPYANLWYHSVSRLFLAAYRQFVSPAGILPAAEAEQRILLRAFLLDKSVSGVVHEMKTRPHWLAIPVKGVESVLSESTADG
jgi:maltose alpha-D-glucosyltransferase/alpha-amylase